VTATIPLSKDKSVEHTAILEKEARMLLESLSRRGLKLALAESCTGGLVSAAITSIPGASSCFWGSIVSYANEAKERVLHVPRKTLEEYGAVSAQTVRDMAQGVLHISGADLSAAISGIAGPEGGSPGKPVGTVWLGLATQDGRTSEELLSLHGDRWQICEAAAIRAIIELRRFAEERSMVLP